ncbi:peptidase M14 [Flavobacterium jejuense]|uniref:Peptidase M14 n=1 Tax=Flavobacterium jejuense TaxID=1544455 RepID=A0ABX0IRX4_9FLAO|nr:M14 metallopeptidase family protein [Flavobacterium jejuense]NHN25966.1 peptidase M14 [Flavobacterium jejuense]
MNSLQLATAFLEQNLKGRYVTNTHIKPLLNNLSNRFKIQIEGKSVQEKDIFSVQYGVGKIKILAWSQMHGNESTTTKALFDVFNYLSSDSEMVMNFYNTYTLYCIPILNPDGAEAYTRMNANQIDLNRDAFELTQPESKLFRSVYNQFKPDFCFNLHDQRTIFGTEGYQLPATVSFLSPAFDETRGFNEVRYKAIKVINAINDDLKQYIPNQIGRFDDSFNINCIGDYLTYKNTPTILFEAGHFKNDYERDEVRKFVFCSLITSLKAISENVIVDNNLEDYLNISQNSKCFYDFLYKNVRIIDNSQEKLINFAAQFTEILKEGSIHLEAVIVQIDDLDGYVGHYEYDAKGMFFNAAYGKMPIIGEKANFSVGNTIKFKNGVQYQ